MTTFVIVAAISGVLFGTMDALINANPLARRLYSVYEPIARTSLNPVAGILIDLFYGFVMATLFVILFEALPGASGLFKGLSFALIAWFFRVLMSVLSQWMMFRIPFRALAYSLVAGLGEMVVLGSLYGVTLAPAG